MVDDEALVARILTANDAVRDLLRAIEKCRDAREAIVALRSIHSSDRIRFGILHGVHGALHNIIEMPESKRKIEWSANDLHSALRYFEEYENPGLQ